MMIQRHDGIQDTMGVMQRQVEQHLCRLDEIPDGGARGFRPNQRREDQLFAVRRGERVAVTSSALRTARISTSAAASALPECARATS
jgi:hypothetical protein